MLEVSKVSRSLERKTLIFWLEITDLFFIVTLCSVLNLTFGKTGLKPYLVYLPTFIITLVLILTKRGKPEGFLLHYFKFQLHPKAQQAFFAAHDEVQLTDALIHVRRLRR